MNFLEFLDHLYFFATLALYLFIVLSSGYLCVIYTHLNAFPTPPFIPIIGHVLDYTDSSTALTKLTNNLIKYGGVIRQYIGPRKPSLVVANKEFLEFLCINNKYVCKSKFYDLIKPWLGEGLITSDGEKWKSRRKALTAKFTQSETLKGFIEVFENKSNTLITVLDDFHNKNINLHPILKRFTFDVICETAMGISFNAQTKNTNTEYAESVETLCEVGLNRMTSFFKYFDVFYQYTDDCIKEKQALAVIDATLEKIIKLKQQKRSKSKCDTDRKDFLDLLMDIEIDARPLSHSDIREEINTFIFAGYDTSSTAICLALYEIGKNTDIQKKLLNEQQQLFKKESPQIDYEVLQQMVYLDMVIKETLRLYSIVPSVGKRITKDLQYCNIKLPAMLNFSIFIHGFHHNPQYYPNPEIFDPERFANSKNIDKMTYLPFGVQPRQCLGKNFSMLEMKCALSKIIRTYEIINIAEHQLEIKPKLVLFSISGIWVKIRKRYKKVSKLGLNKTTE
ncbi:putative cytochrome P450 4s3 isoform X1 [Rhynchophorus ferrugineus]|uniref:putative cytochrome P450 4s3 isoform X1 n=1 Tax=Rhynchophorus ferrugineus TaxID=354439 RepID=UPI003FCCDC55